MKKTTILLSVILSLSLALSACTRRTDEPTAVTAAYENTTQYETLGTTESTSQTTADSESSAFSELTGTTEVTAQPASPSASSQTAVISPASPSQTTGETREAPSGQFEVRLMNAERDGLSIYGNLYVPTSHEQKLPAVILSHSANMTSDSMKSYCERIAKMGLIAYSFDFCGASPQSRSDGKQSDMTIFTEVEDLTAVLQMIQELDFVDRQNIFLFGTSQGGLVSALVAAQYPSDIKGLVLFYPAFNIPETVQRFSKLTPKESQSAYITTLSDFDVYEHIKPYKDDVLIVHGTTDFVVPYSYSEKAAEVYENCELHLIQGATHGFNADNYVSFGDFDRKTWAYAQSFLDKHCQIH